MEKGNYKTFVLTLLCSFIIMYGVMFLNVDQADHIYLSMTRLYMTLMMVAAMALLMLAMMRMMYKNRKLNLIIILSSTAVFVFSLIGVRTQTFVGDVQYMKGMIPHHSIAIMTSKNANIRDPEVRKLADGIIAAQEKEIAQMKRILARMNK
ncbi:DUF305 domain-containing protein [Mucilaginibacter terrenus]|uniref:DUF305 domain-containing protein n=1 Tax=Mucilaginibacter terrenus TaxID=2482727 RepID=A0A3E2NQ19_9SPHI|nr:DUF305 domain-containing protein [Mucilaginibacter terrenus]RFZ83095.1 DUF305 domain-containing protein [Mucilaginibacter terrenus]